MPLCLNVLISLCHCTCEARRHLSSPLGDASAYTTIPFAVATGITDLAGALAFSARLGIGCLEDLCDLLVLDGLTLNEDRHFTNFGLMRDARTGAASGLAPIFDNGRSLLPMLRERRETLLSIPPNERGNLRRAPPRDRKEEAEP